MSYSHMTDVSEVALDLMEGLACPRSLTVAILIRYGEWVQLTELKAAPHEYADAESYWAASAASDFLRKLEGLPTGVDTRKAAIQKWVEGEAACFDTNRRLSPYLYSSRSLGPDEDGGERLAEFLGRVRKEILNVIGSSPREISLQGTFGPGATLSNVSREATIGHKMTSCPTLTHDAWPWLVPWTGTVWAQASAALCNEPVFVEGNHFFTVPKDATTDRPCAKEPAINAYYQRAVGLQLKSLLKRTGVDLGDPDIAAKRPGIDISDGQYVHRQVACLGSQTGEYCTIDLSNASDTVCKVLVELLLPPQWFQLLDSLRSKKTLIEGKWVLLEKFSSMGNGFTFELETLIFLCIARACAREAVPNLTIRTESGNRKTVPGILVFGDDIIVPRTLIDEVLPALRWCGFTPNKRKTYVDGMFRESCGGDFYGGVAVRPHNLKKIPCEPQDWISLANGLRRLSNGCGARWDRLRRAWFRTLGFIPSHVRRLRGPIDLGDLVIHDDPVHWDVERNLRVRNSIRYIRVYRPAKFDTWRWGLFPDVAQFAAAIYLAGKEQSGSLHFSRAREGFPPRDNVLGYKVGWVAYS